MKFTQAGTIATELPPEADVVDFIDGDGSLATITKEIEQSAIELDAIEAEIDSMEPDIFDEAIELTKQAVDDQIDRILDQEDAARKSEALVDEIHHGPATEDGIHPEIQHLSDAIDDEEYMQIVRDWGTKCQEWSGKCLDLRIKHSFKIDELKQELIQLDKLVEDRRQSLKEAQAERKQCLSDLMDGERNGPELPKKPECISYADFLKMKEASNGDPIAIAGVINKEPSQDEDWKSVPTAKIFEGKTIKGLGPKKIEAVCDVAPTLGELEELRNQASLKHLHFCKMLPKGIGEELADAIQDLMYPHTYPNKG